MSGCNISTRYAAWDKFFFWFFLIENRSQDHLVNIAVWPKCLFYEVLLLLFFDSWQEILDFLKIFRNIEIFSRYGSAVIREIRIMMHQFIRKISSAWKRKASIYNFYVKEQQISSMNLIQHDFCKREIFQVKTF